MALSETADAGLFRGAPAYVPRTPWPPFRALLAVLLIVGASILGAALFIGLGTFAGVPGDGHWQKDATELATLGVWQAITLALTLAASALFGGKPSDVLALRSPAGGASIYVKAVLLFAAFQVLISLVQHALFRVDVYADLRPFVRLFAEQWALALLVVGIGAPLSEELLFRGFLLSALAGTRVGFWGGAVITTGLWTALHAGYSPAGIAEVFLIGMLFSWLLWRTGSLWVAIFCHALYNSLIVVVLRYVPLPA